MTRGAREALILRAQAHETYFSVDLRFFTISKAPYALRSCCGCAFFCHGVH